MATSNIANALVLLLVTGGSIFFDGKGKKSKTKLNQLLLGTFGNRVFGCMSQPNPLGLLLFHFTYQHIASISHSAIALDAANLHV